MQMSVIKGSQWLAPKIRPNTVKSTKLNFSYKDEDFRVICKESGSIRYNLPIFETRSGIIKFSDDHGPIEKTYVPNVPGAFVLSNVLTPLECEQIMQLSEKMGYTEDAPVSLGRNIRQNENCVWIADDSLWSIYQ